MSENCESCGKPGCRVCEICWQPECRHHEFKGPELFTILESKSPRMQWMEKHGITTASGIWDAYEGNYRWCAFQHLKYQAYGDTEDEAITQLALNLGIKLWNEEGSK